jgi:hypothetical protein
LTGIQAEPIHVDVCVGGCGGMWFDRLELKQLDEPHETHGEMLLDVAVDESIRVDHSARRNCPKCAEQIMMRFFYSPRRHVEVDHCPECGGHWLDVGELRTIRQQYTSDSARARHFDEMIDEVFGEDLRRMEAKRNKVLDRDSSVGKILAFVTAT